MILLKRGAGDPGRVTHAVAILRPSPLEEVRAALAEYASSGGSTAYVERVGDLYRWSPTTTGGGYPLLCVLARFLRCGHEELTVGFRTVAATWCVVGDRDSAASDNSLIVDLPCDFDQVFARLA
jgi:hypothetical protein